MPLPSNVSFGTVVGRFLTATADGSDADRDPDGIAATDLSIVFTPSLIPAIARDASATPPTVFALTSVPATIGPDGSLLGPDGIAGVRLVASTNPNLDPTGWPWTVTISGGTFPTLSFSFVLDPGATVDLASVIQVPAGPGATLAQWLQAVNDAQAARDAAVAAAASVPSSASLAAGGAPSTRSIRSPAAPGTDSPASPAAHPVTPGRRCTRGGHPATSRSPPRIRPGRDSRRCG